MVVYLVCKHNCNELCDTGENEVGMQSLLILGSTACKTEIIFDVVDVPFDNSPDLVGVIPFFCSTDRSGICTQVFFRVDIDHAPTH